MYIGWVAGTKRQPQKMKYLLKTIETNIPAESDYSAFGETLVDAEVTYEFNTYLEAWEARNNYHGGEIIEAATGLPAKPTAKEAFTIRYKEEQAATERFLKNVWWKEEEASLENKPAPF
tara:strand:+ start:51 stop:407 length:357 start_codon:yes stop_codon:yes gene_type:complete